MSYNSKNPFTVISSVALPEYGRASVAYYSRSQTVSVQGALSSANITDIKTSPPRGVDWVDRNPDRGFGRRPFPSRRPLTSPKLSAMRSPRAPDPPGLDLDPYSESDLPVERWRRRSVDRGMVGRHRRERIDTGYSGRDRRERYDGDREDPRRDRRERYDEDGEDPRREGEQRLASAPPYIQFQPESGRTATNEHPVTCSLSSMSYEIRTIFCKVFSLLAILKQDRSRQNRLTDYLRSLQ
jgi:hypothetical protein